MLSAELQTRLEILEKIKIIDRESERDRQTDQYELMGSE